MYQWMEFRPKLGQNCFIAPSADVIGRVVVGNDVGIWFGVVIRGDVNQIVIGDNSNIQDISMLHVTEKEGIHIGKNVTIAHSVTLHSCTIGDGCLIGMGATVLDGAEIGANSLVAAGSVVSPYKKFPPGSLIKGTPARLERALTEKEINQYSNHYKSYVGYKNQFNNKEKFFLLKD